MAMLPTARTGMMMTSYFWKSNFLPLPITEISIAFKRKLTCRNRTYGLKRSSVIVFQIKELAVVFELLDAGWRLHSRPTRLTKHNHAEAPNPTKQDWKFAMNSTADGEFHGYFTTHFGRGASSLTLFQFQTKTAYLIRVEIGDNYGRADFTSSVVLLRTPEYD